MAQIAFDDFFEEDQLERRLEEAIAMAKEGEARLEIEIRSTPIGGRSRQDGTVTAETSDPPKRIIHKLKQSAEASPGASFEGELRLNMRERGNSQNHYNSFQRQIRQAPHVAQSVDGEQINSHLFNIVRQQGGHTNRAYEVAAEIARSAAQQSMAMADYLKAITPKPPEAQGFLGKIAGPLVGHLLKGGPQQQGGHAPQQAAALQAQQQQAMAYYQQTGQWPPGVPYPGQPQPQGYPVQQVQVDPSLYQQTLPPQEQLPPGAEPAQLPPAPGTAPNPAQQLDPQMVKEWMKANPQMGVQVALSAYNEIPEDQRPLLSDLL